MQRMGRMRAFGQMVGAIGVVMAIAMGAVACSWSGPDEADLGKAVDELSAVEAPDGAVKGRTEVLGCGADAEVPMGVAQYELPGAGLQDATIDERNAKLEEITAWYLPLWKEDGWETIDDIPGSVSKDIGGNTVWASVDAGGDGYAVIAVFEGAAMC